MRLSDTALGLLVLVLGGAITIAALQLPGVPGQAYGAGFFPAIVGVTMGLAGLGLMASGWRRRDRKAVVLPHWLRSPWAVTNVVILAGSVILFATYAEEVGFIPFAVAILWLVQVRLDTPVPRALVVAVIGAVALYLLFAWLLRVPLPQGLMEGVL